MAGRRLFIPLAAAFLGGWSTGSATGAAIGYTVGAQLTAEKQKIDADTLKTQTNAYGVAIPSVVGRIRLAGNIIWATDKKAHSHKSGITTYSMSFAVLICKGPITGIVRVWDGDKLIVDGTSATKKLPGLLYTGTHTQNPDPTIEAIEGSGNVPAWRGYAYMVMDELDLGASGQIPQYTFEVLSDGGV